MTGQASQFPLVAVVGPTGSGKSDLALRIAREYAGEVVNCDSLQLYRYLDIGTAKLRPEERGGIPHHLLDILDPDQVYTAGEYVRTARPLVAAIARRGRLPVIAGGTGFYLRALLEGLFPGPGRDERLRARLVGRESRHPGWLHRSLLRFDPVSAARIQALDIQKLTRAVEVLLLTRRPLSVWFEQRPEPLTGFRVLKLGLDPPRQQLYARLNGRAAAMFAGGLVEEVRQILARGFPPESKALEAVGYKQALRVLKDEIQIPEAIDLTCRDTRHYAKRQWTWFRRDPETIWLQGFGSDEAVQRQALAEVLALLSNSTPIPIRNS
ncbi:MAG TPA: tRNA (adenosine(37)-N6)-dimethylallyltransferase MiaA [Bryobacteraceae bacterium]|nr:tRNA (adenosine(37)-N6)-dimethylallyltransferase MiaA [Bryobacteraceae bacterium]